VARATLESGMAHIVGFERRPASIVAGGGDDYVEADNPLRFIDAFVDGWPCSGGVARVEAKATGKPGYAPGRSQVRQAADEAETAPIPCNSLLAPSPRVIDADARGSFGDQGLPPEDDSRGGDSAADFVNPTSRGNAVTEYWFQPRIESA
jgi:hypothetical protein